MGALGTLGQPLIDSLRFLRQAVPRNHWMMARVNGSASLSVGLSSIFFIYLMKSHSSLPQLKLVCLHQLESPLRMRLVGAELSLYSLALSLLGGRLWLTTSLQELMGGLRLADEVVVVREQLLEVDGRFIKEHTGDYWSGFVSEGSLDGTVDVVSDEGLPVLTLELVKA